MDKNKMNYSGFCEYLNFDSTELIQEINEFIDDNQNKFFISKMGQNRIDFNTRIIIKIKKIFPFLISDAGVFKNPPGWIYPTHRDARRQFAVNMLLSDENDDFETLFYSDDGKEKYPIPYIKNQWVLLNTKRFHSVKNLSTDVDRYTISVGCCTKNYNDMVSEFQSLGALGLPGQIVPTPSLAINQPQLLT
jgi:hypothetical protein